MPPSRICDRYMVNLRPHEPPHYARVTRLAKRGKRNRLTPHSAQPGQFATVIAFARKVSSALHPIDEPQQLLETLVASERFERSVIANSADLSRRDLRNRFEYFERLFTLAGQCPRAGLALRV